MITAAIIPPAKMQSAGNLTTAQKGISNLRRKSQSWLLAAVCSIALSVGSADAAIIVHGNLLTDSTGNTILDTLTGRTYTRFDAFNLTYAETFEMIASPLSEFYGWSVATSDISDDFINAMFGTFGTNVCTVGVDVRGESCGQLAGWSDGNFGSSWSENTDYYAYLNNTVGGYPLGQLALGRSGWMNEYDNWSDIGTLDYWGNSRPTLKVNLLLYFDGKKKEVPEPATAIIVVFGLAGIALRRKKSATDAALR